jgi:hypothetical protein
MSIQLRIPFRKHLYGVVRRWEWASGLHTISREQEYNEQGFNYLYTNRGLATHPPLRLFCDPEIAIITLVNNPKQPQI